VADVYITIYETPLIDSKALWGGGVQTWTDWTHGHAITGAYLPSYKKSTLRCKKMPWAVTCTVPSNWSWRWSPLINSVAQDLCE